MMSLMKPKSFIKNIIGKQYGYRSNANRAIRNFKVKHFVDIPKGYKWWVNQIDNGCYEIDGGQY